MVQCQYNETKSSYPIINDTFFTSFKTLYLGKFTSIHYITLQAENIQRMFLDDTVPSKKVITSMDAGETILQ